MSGRVPNKTRAGSTSAEKRTVGSYVVHHYHDEASVELAKQVVERLPKAALMAEPVDDLSKSGIRVFDEESQRWVFKHEWIRGSEMNLGHITYQIVKGLLRPAPTRDYQLRKELGMEKYSPVRRRWQKVKERKK